MNKETIEMLKALAEKLGTTSEYLWAVLIKQAYINAFLGILFLIAVIIIDCILISLHKRFSKKDSDNYRDYYDTHEGLGIIMSFAGIAFLILSVGAFFIIPYEVATALLNPEYWALDQILDTIKPK